jgi:hypothetical protein
MKSLISGCACLTLAACVSSGPESQLGTQAKASQAIKMTRTSDCVFQSTISDFTTLDNEHVVLYSMGKRKAYLAQIAPGCFDVKSQVSLAAVDGDRNGQICGFGRDSVAYRNLGMVEDCRIMGLEELSDERRVQLGVGVPEKKPRKEDKPEEAAKDGDSP